MILKLYKSNISLGLILLPLLIIVICLPLLFTEQQFYNYSYAWQNEALSLIKKSNVFNFIISLVLVSLNTYLISKVLNNSIIFSKQSFLPSIVYLIFLSSSSSFVLPYFLVVNFLLIVLMGLLIIIDKINDTVHFLFRSSLIVGVLICISYHFILLLFILVLYLLVYRKVNLRDIIIALLGLSIPLIYTLSLQFLMFDKINLDLNLRKISYELFLLDRIKIGLMILFSVMILQRLRGVYISKTSGVKKQLYIIYSLFFTTLLSSGLVLVVFNELNSFFLVPFVILSSISMLAPKKDTIISILLTIVLIVNIVSIYLG